MQKTLINYIPFFTEGCGSSYEALWAKRGFWHAKWIANTEEQNPHLSAYRNRFHLDGELSVRIHVSGDAVYLLFLDGRELLRGPEAGTLDRYCFDTLDLNLSAGDHVFCALTWCFGPFAPSSKICWKNGFILGAEGKASAYLDTNSVNWQGKILPGATLEKCAIWEVGPENRIDYALFPENVISGEGTDWNTPLELSWGHKSDPGIVFRTDHYLSPARLPSPCTDEIPPPEVVYVSSDRDSFHDAGKTLPERLGEWQRNIARGTFSVDAHAALKILMRLDDYYCGFPVLACSGGRGAEVSVRWAEALYLDRDFRKKGNRKEFRNRYFTGHSDTLLCGGGENQVLYAPWYRAGVFVELLIQTADEPLTVRKFGLREFRYPMSLEAAFESDDSRLNRCVGPMARTLQMCMHDTYMDCPYYEQMMYLGDTRLQLLLNYNLNRDRRLAEKSIRLMLAGRLPDGLLAGRFPASAMLSIPTFTMLFAGIVNDYVKYAGNPAFLREIMPAARSSVDALEACRRSDGLIVFPDAWCFTDWVRKEWADPALRAGSPPESDDHVSGIVNWTYAYALGQMAEAHAWTGEHELAERYRRLGRELADTLVRMFHHPETGLFSDIAGGASYSEHGQCLALLSGFLPPRIADTVREALFSRKVPLTESTVYFSFYYLETCVRLHRMDRFMERMNLWFDMLKSEPFTVFESPEPSRSDCHAWSAHPLYHFLAGILGIRPGSSGFHSVLIQPEPGSLRFARGKIPHPAGEIAVEFSISQDSEKWEIHLPEPLKGEFRRNGQSFPLPSGRSEFRIASRRL